jgi:hypothetical protein
VPDEPGGPGGVSGSEPTAAPSPVLQDIVAIVDATNGGLLEVRSDRPDAQAQPAPPTEAPGKPNASPS